MATIPDEWGLRDVALGSSHVPDGWMKLVEELLNALDDVPGWKREFLEQIKDKFGGLRVYYMAPYLESVTTKRVDQLIRAAELRAWRTCEECGSEGDHVQQVTPKTWILTLCDKCLARHRSESIK